MGITIKIISGANGSAFATALSASISAGERPVGSPWSDATNTYQEVEVHDNRELFYNKDLLSRVWRAKKISGEFPQTSVLSAAEIDSVYNSLAY